MAKKRKRQPSSFSKINRIWKIFAGITIVVGFIGGIKYICPKVSVSPALSLDPASAFSSPFKIKNDGLFPVYNVRYKVNSHVEFVPKPGRHVFDGPAWDLTDHLITKIGPGEDATVMLPLKGESTIVVQFADIRMVVEFEPIKYIHIKWSWPGYFHFNTAKSADGKLIWYSQPFTNKTSISPNLK